MNALQEWSAKVGLKRKFIWTVAIIGLLFLIFVCVAVFGSFSDGNRAGIVTKISTKGYIFKTHEGQLYLGGIGGSTNEGIGIAGNNWSFSVTDEAVVKQLEEAAASGKRVSLHYEQKYFKLVWRGDTEYIVDRVDAAQ